MSSPGLPSFRHSSASSSSSRLDPGYQYDFAKGHPNPDELPVQELQSLLSRSTEQDSSILKEALQYGASAGKPRVLEQLSAFVQQQCGDDELLLSGIGGKDHDETTILAQQPTFFFVTGTKPGDVVWTECPTYYLAAGIFHSHHLEIGSLPMQEHGRGIDLDRLEERLRRGEGGRPHLIYTIPAHHNPVGHVMLAQDRQRLAQLAAEYQFVVLADEVYHLLDWSNEDYHNNNKNPNTAANEPLPPRQRRPARMVQWNVQPPSPGPTNNAPSAQQQQQQRWSGCISMAALTKIFAPGMRFGWIETVDSTVIDAIEKVGYIRSQGGVSPVTGLMVAQGLRDGTMNAVLTRLRRTYQIRCNMLCDILERVDFNDPGKKQNGGDDTGLQLICRPSGGYFVWVRLPQQLESLNDFLDYCRQERGVNFLPGPRCSALPMDHASSSSDSPPLERYARFCFAYLDTETLRRGAEAFVECYREYLHKTTPCGTN